MQGARLSCRSPERFSRCRVTRPEEAGIGLAPARAANAASERSRPAYDQLTRTWAALIGPTPGSSSSHGATAAPQNRSEGSAAIPTIGSQDAHCLVGTSLRAVITVAPPWRWPITQAGGWPARLLLAVTVATVVTAWLTAAATGQLTRWLPTLPGLPAVTAGAAATGTSLVDATLLLVLATGALPAPGAAPWRLVVLAALASLVRCALASRAARRCLTIRPTPS
jgi:hypothetical protein